MAAGGFQAVTNPSFVLTLRDYGHDAASQDDIAALSNALGYVLNQGGTAHFNLDLPKPYDFALDYAASGPRDDSYVFATLRPAMRPNTARDLSPVSSAEWKSPATICRAA